MAITASVKKNTTQNGIEIYFSGIPSEATRNNLKEHHWRYHKGKQCWYIYYTSENMNFANRLQNKYSQHTGTIAKKSSVVKKKRKKHGKKMLCSLPVTDYKASYTPDVVKAQDINVDTIHKEREWGTYQAISPKDVRYKKKRSFFS